MSAEPMRRPRRRVAGGGFYGLNKRENAAAGGGGDDGGSGVLTMTVAGDQGFSASGRLRATRGLASPGREGSDLRGLDQRRQARRRRGGREGSLVRARLCGGGGGGGSAQRMDTLSCNSLRLGSHSRHLQQLSIAVSSQVVSPNKPWVLVANIIYYYQDDILF
jgi:hypothetical protein